MPTGQHMTERMNANDPTPEQIAERAAEIRAEWTPDERRKRDVHGRYQQPYEIPTVSVAASGNVALPQ